MSCASILRELKERVNPDELGATARGIRETRSKDLLVQLKYSKRDKGRLDTAFKEEIGAIPRIEFKVADLEPRVEAEDVEEAIRGFFQHKPEMYLRVSLTKTPYRGKKKAYVLLEEARALKFLKVAHIKIGWVSYRVSDRSRNKA